MSDPDPVTYTAVLPVDEDTVQFVSALLAADRRQRRTRPRRRALSCYRQAVLVLRWFVDGIRLAQLAADNAIGGSTAYRYLHEGIDVLADRAPGLRGALLAARAAGHSHVTVDGTLIRTPLPRSRPDRPDRPIRPPGRPVVVGQARRPWRQRAGHRRPGRLAALDLTGAAGREHDTTALRTHSEALPTLAEWTDANHAALADLGYEGERAALTTPIKQAPSAG